MSDGTHLGLARTRSALAATLSLVVAGGAYAQYETTVIARDLRRPTGIAVDQRGNVYFTQIPTPGVPGPDGGMNTVSRLDRRGRITKITLGEPEPTHIAVTRDGRLYWTCKSAGVILTHDEGETQLVLRGLEQPSGIDVVNRGPRAGDVYFTQLPTPGVPGDRGGRNTVNVFDGKNIETLTLGEPEPTDIVVSRNGTAYWTCKSAGVILTKPRDGEKRLLLGDLHEPVGIAMDGAGDLYFTEVPTPGVPGPNGGMNRVWKLDPRSGDRVLIDEGDPEPTDVAVTRDGRTVYWTCSSAGVIVAATRK